MAFSLEQDIVLCSSFSYDESMIATGSKDNTVAIWSDDGKLIKKLKGYTSPVTSVAFSAQNKYLNTVPVDGK